MFEKFLSTNAGDFRQRYVDTYGWFVKDGKRILVKISDVEDRTVYFKDRQTMDYHLHVDAPGDTGFEFIPPKNAYHNSRSGAVLIKRVAQRQFSRGLCDRNTRIVLFDQTPTKINFDILEQLFVNKTPTAEAIRNFLDKKVHSVAISPSFALGYGIIKCYEATLGTYDLDAKTYQLKQPDMWRTEFNDALIRSGLTNFREDVQ